MSIPSKIQVFPMGEGEGGLHKLKWVHCAQWGREKEWDEEMGEMKGGVFFQVSHSFL